MEERRFKMPSPEEIAANGRGRRFDMPSSDELVANGLAGYTFDELVALECEFRKLGFPCEPQSDATRRGAALGAAALILCGDIPPKSEGLSLRSA